MSEKRMLDDDKTYNEQILVAPESVKTEKNSNKKGRRTGLFYFLRIFVIDI